MDGDDGMEFRVRENDAGLTVKTFLKQRCGISETSLRSAKWNQGILLNGTPAAVNLRVRFQDVISVEWIQSSPVYQVQPYDIPLKICYHDEHLMVIDKQAPLASQSSRNHPDDSLENAVYAYLHCPENFIYRPVNRLDKGTSGLMVIALTGYAQHRMQSMLHTDSFLREYLAVTEGIPVPAKGTIVSPIRKAEGNTIRREVHPMGKACMTHYTVLESGKSRSLVRLRLETGRTHQIRVHLASLSCPVAGDFLYGTELLELPGRFALHSCELIFEHPITGKTLSFTSPLPAEIESLLSGSEPS